MLHHAIYVSWAQSLESRLRNGGNQHPVSKKRQCRTVLLVRQDNPWLRASARLSTSKGLVLLDGQPLKCATGLQAFLSLGRAQASSGDSGASGEGEELNGELWIPTVSLRSRCDHGPNFFSCLVVAPYARI